MEVVRRSFRPEFLNRLDEIILFNRLGRNEMKRIVDIQLRHLQHLLEDAHQIDELVRQSPERAYDIDFFENFAAAAGSARGTTPQCGVACAFLGHS